MLFTVIVIAGCILLFVADLQVYRSYQDEAQLCVPLALEETDESINRESV